MKKGLVLEGGAMRGLFTAGIIDVMMEAKVEPDGLIGVSAGAAFGCNYKSRQPGRAIRYNKRFARDKRYCSWQSWLKTGNLYNADFGYRIIPTQYDIFDDKAFEGIVGTLLNLISPKNSMWFGPRNALRILRSFNWYLSGDAPYVNVESSMCGKRKATLNG